MSVIHTLQVYDWRACTAASRTPASSAPPFVARDPLPAPRRLLPLLVSPSPPSVLGPTFCCPGPAAGPSSAPPASGLPVSALRPRPHLLLPGTRCRPLVGSSRFWSPRLR